jgi:CBS-domain-containing membrane protein
MEQLPDLLKPVKDYLEQYHPESFNTLTARPETLLRDVIKEAAEGGVHRVWVLDADNKPCGVVALRDMIDCVLNTVV